MDFLLNNTVDVPAGNYTLNKAVSIESIICYSVLVWRIYLPRYQHLTIAISFSLTILPVTLANFALSYGLYKVGDWKRKSKFFIFALGISDMLCGLVTIPSNVLFVTKLSYERVCWFEITFLFVGQANGHMSFYLLMAIALERYLNVMAALKFGETFSRRLARFVSSDRGHRILFSAIVCCSLLHGLVSSYFFNHVRSNVANYLMMGVRTVILFTIYVVYFRIYFAIKKYDNDSQVLAINQHRATLRTVITLLIIYTVCYVPCLLTDFWTSYYSYVKKSAAPSSLRFTYYLSFTLVYLNAAINAVVLLRANKKALSYDLSILAEAFPTKKGKRRTVYETRC